MEQRASQLAALTLEEGGEEEGDKEVSDPTWVSALWPERMKRCRQRQSPFLHKVSTRFRKRPHEEVLNITTITSKPAAVYQH